jgi:transposase
VLTPGVGVRIFISSTATDLRRSFDGLRALVESALGLDPWNGDWFVFWNRLGNRVKILCWDRTGWSMWYKRLEGSRFSAPIAEGGSTQVNETTLRLLLDGVALKARPVRSE